MVRLKITESPTIDHLALSGYGIVNWEVRTANKVPAEVFDALLAMGVTEWELDVEDASDEEATEWCLADITCRKILAERMGKTIIIDGEPINYEEFDDKLIAFIQGEGVIPDVIDDNSMSLILGTLE